MYMYYLLRVGPQGVGSEFRTADDPIQQREDLYINPATTFFFLLFVVGSCL